MRKIIILFIFTMIFSNVYAKEIYNFKTCPNDSITSICPLKPLPIFNTERISLIQFENYRSKELLVFKVNRLNKIDYKTNCSYYSAILVEKITNLPITYYKKLLNRRYHGMNGGVTLIINNYPNNMHEDKEQEFFESCVARYFTNLE